MCDIDNKQLCWYQDLESHLKPGAKLSLLTPLLSLYAFEKLLPALNKVAEVRVLFTGHELASSLLGLWNDSNDAPKQMELKQRALASALLRLVKEKKLTCRLSPDDNTPSIALLDNAGVLRCYSEFTNFNACSLGNYQSEQTLDWVEVDSERKASRKAELFQNRWESAENCTDELKRLLALMAKETSARELYNQLVYCAVPANKKETELDINEQNGDIWKQLYEFQRDAAYAVIRKLETYNGCILADSVGLGKTYTALAVIKHYACRGVKAMVLCPKRLSANWMEFTQNVDNNNLSHDDFHYDVFYHTDLSRSKGKNCMGTDLDRVNWSGYGLVVIDESHNFRNGGTDRSQAERKLNRYDVLNEKILHGSTQTKVLMLSATPVNNRFWDLYNQLALIFPEQKEELFNNLLPDGVNVGEVLRQATQVCKDFERAAAAARASRSKKCGTPDIEDNPDDVHSLDQNELYRRLSPEFFKLLEAVSIARSRKHIVAAYDASAIGHFPTRLKPGSCVPKLDGGLTYDDLFEKICSLQLNIYRPSKYLLNSARSKYGNTKDNQPSEKQSANLQREGRENGMMKVMGVNLLKRLESAVDSFEATLGRLRDKHKKMLERIDSFKKKGKGACTKLELLGLDAADLTSEETDLDDILTTGGEMPIDLADMDFTSWERDLKDDLVLIEDLLDKAKQLAKYDTKLANLKDLVHSKLTNPSLNSGNRKMLIFTSYSDTAKSLYEDLKDLVLEQGTHIACVTGTGCWNSAGLPEGDSQASMERILKAFSPRSKKRCENDNPVDIDILIATDCLSEGQNLQDCDMCVNYDVHWNPVRLIQRFGRVDRLESQNDYIQMVTFWPTDNLDLYLNLIARVTMRLGIANTTATGDDNILEEPDTDSADDYRLQQLKQIKNENVDIEDLQGGLSIQDLGYSEFRSEAWSRELRNKLGATPRGRYAIVYTPDEDAPEGTIFALHYEGESANDANPLHPNYLVYVSDAGDIVYPCDQPRKILTLMKRNMLACPQGEIQAKPGSGESLTEAERQKQVKLLHLAVDSIVDTKNNADVASLFKPGQTSLGSADIQGLQDFSLLGFVVIRHD